MSKLSVPNSHDNYGTYLQSLRSSLILSPDKQESTVWETFLQEMQDHPAISVKNKFAALSVQYYSTNELPMPFTQMVDLAERLVEISDLTATPVPRRTAATPNQECKTLPTASSSPSDDILTLLAARVDAQQDTMKKMVGLLSSLENSQKLIKANYAKTKPSHCGGTKKNPGSQNRMPPFANQAPSDTNEVRTWNEKSWYWCAKCKQGIGCWSPSHSTNGNDALSIEPHRGPTNNKRAGADTVSETKKQKTNDSTKNRQDLKVMKARLITAGGQSMAAILAARKNPGFQGEQD
jgi:hypothetical protein